MYCIEVCFILEILLRYKQTPNYDYLLKLFSNIMVNNNYEYDYIFDWNIIAKQKKLDREIILDN